MADQQLAQMMQDARNREQWLRYDSIVIGPGAKDVNAGWFNNFQEFANADNLTWFTAARNGDVGLAYTNISGTQEDFAQRIYQSGVEFIAPIATANFDDAAAEGSGILQSMFVAELSKRMDFRFRIQDTDNVVIAPGIHLPGATGIEGQYGAIQGALAANAGHTGSARVENSWKWPDPLALPAKSKITVSASIAKPIKEWLQQLDNLPASKSIPVPDGTDADGNPEFKFASMRNWYVIRVWHRGPRYVQFRGTYSAM